MLRLLIALGFATTLCVLAEDACTDTTGGDCTCSCTCGECIPNTEPEPTPLAPCQIGYAGGNKVTTYDGNSLELVSDNKFTLTEWLPNSDHLCKFRVRVDTKLKNSDITMKWAGFGFTDHLVQEGNFDRNFRFSQGAGVLELRGRGYETPEGVHTPLASPIELSRDTGIWTFTTSSPASGVYETRAEAVGQGCVITVLYEEGKAGGNSEKYDRLTVTPNEFYTSDNALGTLTGACGDRNGDPSNDDDAQFCYYPPEDPTGWVQPTGWNFRCVDGLHQGN